LQEKIPPVRLFMFYAGDNFRNSNTELRGVRLLVGETVRDCYEDVGASGGATLEVCISIVEAERLKAVPKTSLSSSTPLSVSGPPRRAEEPRWQAGLDICQCLLRVGLVLSAHGQSEPPNQMRVNPAPLTQEILAGLPSLEISSTDAASPFQAPPPPEAYQRASCSRPRSWPNGSCARIEAGRRNGLRFKGKDDKE
jgi:hypothetical protein